MREAGGDNEKIMWLEWEMVKNEGVVVVSVDGVGVGGGGVNE